MQRLRIAGFSEANLYDALVDTAQRMQDIEGRKAILLLSSGIDTFSKLTYDKTRKAMQDAGVPIYAIGLMQAHRIMMERRMGAIQRLDFLQADNQMRTFAKESGGMAFFPRFYGEMPGIFQAITQAMRNQYVLSYSPTNQARDGKFRKIKVDLVNPETNEPLRVVDEKGKPIKYQIVAKPATRRRAKSSSLRLLFRAAACRGLMRESSCGGVFVDGCVSGTTPLAGGDGFCTTGIRQRRFS